MTTLEKVSHISLIGVSCVALALLVEHRIAAPPTQADPARVLTGRTLDLELSQSKHAPVTLVFHLSSTCIYCAQSQPFYERLTAARDSIDSPVRLVVATADSTEVMRKYLATSHVAVDDILHTDQGVAGAHQTPIILAVDSRGVIRHAFVGKLVADREKEVLSIVTSGRL